MIIVSSSFVARKPPMRGALTAFAVSVAVFYLQLHGCSCWTSPPATTRPLLLHTSSGHYHHSNGGGGGGTGIRRRSTQTQRTILSAASYSNSGGKGRGTGGTASNPLDKKKVAVLGGGGYFGAVTFGFLQRASSLYGTGIGGVRCIGSTADTSQRLNRILSKHFCLAVADESVVKLTDLVSSPADAVADRLAGWDALVFGADLNLQMKPVTPNTYEKGPNDKTWEVYWGNPKGGFSQSDVGDDEADRARMTVLGNLLQGARRAGVQRLIAVEQTSSAIRLEPLLRESGIPYLLVRHGELSETKDYTYRNGVQGELLVRKLRADDSAGGDGAAAELSPAACEDVAALCVQSLLSVDWSDDACIEVTGTSNGIRDYQGGSTNKRPDQEWCVNSDILQNCLAKAAAATTTV